MVKLIKPMKLSCIQNVQTINAEKYLVATLYFGVDLKQREALVSEDQYLSTSIARMPGGTVPDQGFPKGQAEVLVAGEAQAPEGKAAQSVEVSVSVGGFRKRALVFGNRFWTRQHSNDYTLTQAEPFERQLLEPARAFGGGTHATNKLGKGFQIDYVMQEFGYAALPNIEDPETLILHPGDAPEPVVFGPLDADHPLRKSCLGQVDGAWLHTTFPGPPPGFSFEYFNVASQDQRLATPLAGDEAIVIRGMDAETPELRSSLPGLVPRLFAVHDENAETLTEIPLKCDTLWVFGTDGLAGVYFRGLLKTSDEALATDAGLIAGLERLSDEPRSPAHYAEVFRLRTDPVDGPLHALNEQQLMPELSEAELQDIEARSNAYTEKVASKAERYLNASLEDMKAKSGLPEALHPTMNKPDVPRIPLPDPDDLLAGRVDMVASLKKTLQAMDGLRALEDKEGAAAEAFIEKSGLSLPKVPESALEEAVKSGDPQASDIFKSVVQDLIDPAHLAENAKKMAQEAPDNAVSTQDAVTDAVDDILKQLNIMPDVPDEEDLFQKARARALALPEADPFYKLKQQLEGLDASAFSIPDPQSLVPPDAKDAFSEVGTPESPIDSGYAQVAATAAELDADTKAALETVDAALADLLPGTAGKDVPPSQVIADELGRLASQNQETLDPPTLLKEAREAVSMTEDDFFADLDEDEREHLLGQDHERSKLPEAVYPLETYSDSVCKRLGDLVVERLAEGENFSRRDIAGADLSERDLASGLDLSGTLMEKACLIETNLSGANLTAAALTAARMERAWLDRADFSRANLSRCAASDARFLDCRFSERFWLEPTFKNAVFDGSEFTGQVISKGDFAGASLEGCSFENCVFLNCDFSGGKFDKSRLSNCTFIDCTAPDTSWFASGLKKVLFTDLKAPNSDWGNMTISNSNFAGKTDLSGAYLDRIDAHHVTFLGSTLSECLFLRSKMRECSFLNCDMSNSDCRALDGKRSMFTGVDLNRANLFAANLLEVQFDACEAPAASFRSANLYSANLSGLTLPAADLTGANTGRTILELPTNAD